MYSSLYQIHLPDNNRNLKKKGVVVWSDHQERRGSAQEMSRGWFSTHPLPLTAEAVERFLRSHLPELRGKTGASGSNPHRITAEA